MSDISNEDNKSTTQNNIYNKEKKHDMKNLLFQVKSLLINILIPIKISLELIKMYTSE